MRPVEATPAMAEFLGELNLSGYQELGFSTVLLVEGPTELRTVQGLLRHYRLEHKVVLVPLGGGSMIRAGVAEPLREIKRLTPSVYALIDSERSAEGEPLDERRMGFKRRAPRQRLNAMFSSFVRLRTTSPITRSSAFGDSYSALGPYEKLSESAKPWSKPNHNWRIAAEMAPQDLAGSDLGKFFETLTETVESEADTDDGDERIDVATRGSMCLGLGEVEGMPDPCPRVQWPSDELCVPRARLQTHKSPRHEKVTGLSCWPDPRL